MKTANTQSCRTARNLLLSFAAAAALAATGGEVTAERAVNATSAWIAHSTAPSRLPTGDVRTFSLNGTNVFHLVALRGGGWVAMPADDAYESILAFSFDEDAELPDEDDGCPGWGFLAYCAGMDVMTSPNGSAGEDDAFDNGHVCGGDRPFFTIMPSMTPPRLTERDTSDSTNAEPGRSIGRKSLDAGSGRLQATKSVNALKGEDEQLDIRVPSFVKSRWSQSTAQSKYCYNYYTPEHSVCGCVATAMAQVMRHFEWPASNVVLPMTNVQHRISYRGETIVTNFISGAFDWSKMPYNPGKKSNLTDEECEMIGRLTFDCGVSLGMDYDSGGSSPDSANGGNSTRGGLKNDFGYGHGCYIGSVSAANIKNSLLPSLDAKRPASCSIPGHMVVADGYAFKNGELYIHLNMGWGGLSDAYYSAFGGSSNRRIGSAHYNLTTNGTVRIASGRVTDQNGAPLSGVTVYAKVLMSGETTPTSQTVTTDDYGIYAVETPSGMHSIDISAEKEGYVSLCESLTAATSSEDAGNSWGNDFVLVAWNSTCEWTGDGDGTTFGDGDNWDCGIAPTNCATLVFGAETPSFVTNDIPDFTPAAIVFLPECPKVEIGGLGLQDVVAMASSAAERPVFATNVAFADAINVSGAMEFRGGVQGTYPVHHDVYYGDYRLTATEWTLSSAITVAEGSSLIAPDTTITETAAQLICGEAGSQFKAKELVYHTIKGYAFGPFAGEADIGKIDFDKKKWYGFSPDFTGTLRVGGLYFYSTPESGSEGDYLRFYSNGRFVIGSENGDSYLMGSRGTFNLREADATEPLVLNSAADWDMIAVAPRAGARLGHGFAIDSQGVVIDTSDFDGSETGHTVTVKKSGNPASVLKGSGYLAATGNGTLKFDASCTFSGGLVASNGVTLALADGVTPGNGDLTMEGGTTLALPDTKNCTATVAGTFRIAEGDSQQVNVRIGAATTELARGNYRLLTANGGFGEGVSAASFALANPTASGAVTTFELNGGELWLSVVVPGDYVWAGGSSGANWTAADKWTFGGESATWSALNGNTATFASDGDTATVDEQVSVSRVNFNANATINGNATLSVPSVSVVPNVSATISAPTAGALVKSGAGTLTLGSSRVDQTTLDEGTLAMANGATLDSSKLTLGTDIAKPVALDYGGQTLTANPTAYLGAGMDVTLTNGVFKNSSDIKFIGSSIPSVLTVAKGSTMQTDNRFNWNSTVGTNTINVVGGAVKSKANSNNWIMQNTRTGRLDVNVTDGGLLEFGGETYMLTCRDGDNDYQSPELNMRVVDSAVRVKNGKSLRLGYDDDTKSSATPVFSLVATNSVFDVGWGFNLGNGKSGLPTAGAYTAEFEDTVTTARFFRVYKDRTLNHASFNGSAIVFNSGSGGIIAMDDDAKWITVGAKGLTLDTNGMNNEVKANLGGDGAVTKAGAGKLTITKDKTATGGFICAAGETALDAGVTIVARPVTVKDGAKFTVNGTATKSVVSLALEAGSTLDLNGFASDVAAIAVTSFAAPTAGTATLKRNGAAFQSGEYVILEKDGVTAADAENLVPVVENGASYSYSVAGDKLILSVTTYDFPSVWHGGKKVDDAMLAKFHAWRAKYAVSEFQEDYEDAFLLGVDPADDCQIKISSISITGDGPDQVVTIQTDNDFSLINGRLLVRSFSSLGEPTRSDISAVVTSAGAVRLGDDKSIVIGLDGSAPTRFYKLVVDYGDGE